MEDPVKPEEIQRARAYIDQMVKERFGQNPIIDHLFKMVDDIPLMGGKPIRKQMELPMHVEVVGSPDSKGVISHTFTPPPGKLIDERFAPLILVSKEASQVGLREINLPAAETLKLQILSDLMQFQKFSDADIASNRTAEYLSKTTDVLGNGDPSFEHKIANVAKIGRTVIVGADADYRVKYSIPIFSRDADPHRVRQDLLDLTAKTAKSHTVHDFSFETWGKAVVSLTPYKDAPFARISAHSPTPFKNGDLLVTSVDGKKTVSMVFDVKKLGNPPDLYEAHAVQANPQIGIGHAVVEPSIKTESRPTVRTAKNNPTAQPEKPAAAATHEPHAPAAAAKPGISPTLANHLKVGARGVVGVGAAIASGAPKTVEEGLKLGAEAILPGSTTAGNDVCKMTGTVAGGVAGTAAAMGAGALAFGGTVVPTTPVGATVISVAAGAAAFTATQPVAKLGTEALCNAVLSDGVKNAANKALRTLHSALTFGGSEKVAQNSHKQQVATGSQGKQ
ncbi:MAG: hypothetical protein ACK52W_03485 [Alphaproteobacteria bacterium]